MRSYTGRLFYGWWIVAAFFVLNVYWAGTLVSGLTVFFSPIRHSFGWSAALVAFLFSLTTVVTGLLAPLVGAWFDRSGARGLMLLAGLLAGAGLLLAAQAASLPVFLLGWLPVCAGFGIWAAGTGPAAANLWFVRRRGLAMGVILAGSSVGGLLLPVWSLVVDAAGWRTAFVIDGLGLWLITVPCSLVLYHRPSDRGLLPDGDAPRPSAVHPSAPTLATAVANPNARAGAGLRTALRTRQFWTVAAVTALMSAASGATVVLMLSRLQEAQLANALAVTAVTVVTLLGGVGFLGVGWLADRAELTTLAVLTCLLQAVGLVAFAVAPQQVPLLIVFVLGFGLGSGNIRLLAALILARYYGAAAFGRIQGILFFVLLHGGVLGPVAAGAIHDAGHGYGAAFILYALITLAMIVPLLLLRPPDFSRRSGWVHSR